MFRIIACLCLVVCPGMALCLGMVGADEPAASEATETDEATDSAARRALAVLQPYVGAWRGVGQLKRGSTQGAWSEQARWAWNFENGSAAIIFEADDAKYYVSGRFEPAEKPGAIELVATRPDGQTTDRFVGTADDRGQIVLVAEEPTEGQPHRVSLRQVAEGDRMLMLYERKLPGAERYARLAEVGFTRKGSGFAKGSVRRECLVTGGLGTIAVEHSGKTYYVCCEGCKDLFEKDPQGVLAEYRARKEEEKKQEAEE